MTAAGQRTIEVAGGPCRVWEQGEGKPIGFLGGLGGVPRWTPFLDRLAEHRRVVVLSPPGFPGSGDQHKSFTSYLDWVIATLDLLEGAGLAGADLIGASVGGLLAADVAALSPGSVRRLVLAAPMGIYDVDDPGEDPFAQTPESAVMVQSANPAAFVGAFAPDDPEDGAAVLEWTVMLYRCGDAAARITWPLGDRALARRLHRVRQPTMILWGDQDRILPPTYAKRFVERISGPTEVRILEGAGHQVIIDQPDAAASAVLGWLS